MLSKRLKEALIEASAVLGKAAYDAIFHGPELNGITFRDRSYTLGELWNAHRKVFRHYSTMLLMQRL